MKVEGYNAGANKTKEDKKDETKGMKKENRRLLGNNVNE